MSAHSNQTSEFSFCSKLILIILSFTHIACSTMSYRQKVISTMAIGAALGGAYGTSKTDYRNTHTAMYGSMGAAAGALVATALLNPDEKSEQLLLENKKLTSELSKYKMPEIISEGSAFKQGLPPDLLHIVKPGNWQRSKIDKWIQDPSDEFTWFHQDERFHMIPPEAK